MATTQPIRSREKIEELKLFFLERDEIRNYTLVVVGMNLPLRISDLLSIKWGQVYNLEKSCFYQHIILTEKKTKKKNILPLNQNIQYALNLLLSRSRVLTPNTYIFHTDSSEKPLSRISAYIIIRNAAEAIGLQNIGCHSLRKTFGYHAWKNGVHLALIMSIYNHSSIHITKRYLGIEQDDKDNVFYSLNL